MNTKRLLYLLMISLVLAFSACNKNKEECEGCDSETPWSNAQSSYCYPSQEDCEQETQQECEKCR